MSLIARVRYRAIQLLRREPVFKALKDLEQSQWWSPERLRELQLSKLRHVVAAGRNTDHYREAWGRIGGGSDALRSLDELSRFPVLEKETLRRDADRLLNRAYRGPVNVTVTTGSSGVPLSVKRSRVAGAYGRASQIRGRRWFGIEFGDAEVRFGGQSIERRGRLHRRVIDGLMARTSMDAGSLSEDDLASYLEIVRRLRPRVLYGYPSTLALFASFVERNGGGADLGVKLVGSSSELLFEHRRQIIQEAFRCPVADEYGATEVSILAMECPEGGFHHSAESTYVEITDSDGCPVAPGEEGDVVVTDLNNLAAPLLRYRLGDRARWVPGGCACGRGLPLLEILAGSSFGMVDLPDGRRLSGVVFYFLAESLITDPGTGVAEMVVVRRGQSFEARVLPSGAPDAIPVQEIRSGLTGILGAGVPVTVTIVEQIQRRGSDKYRILLDEDEPA
jgi:phenylacetate-CoA ligase